MSDTTAANFSQQKTTIIFAWLVTLLASTLPEIIWREGFGGAPEQTVGFRLAVLFLALLTTFFWSVVQPIRGFFLVLLVIQVLESWVNPAIASAVWWKDIFGEATASWGMHAFGIQLLRLLVVAGVLATLTLSGLRRMQYFLDVGQLDAPVEPVRWLGITPGGRWKRFGVLLAVIITALLLAFTWFSARPALADFTRALPWLPVVLLLAALNAFNEELPYRAALLSQLEKPLGKEGALWLTAVWFGLGHFYGAPPGVAGVFMAGLLAYLLGKSMLETRGFFWAWLIHFLQDVVIFTFFAMAG